MDWRPSNLTNVFALDSDFAIGLLSSRIHTDWAAAKSSTLEDRIRYTPSSAFETFPWPDANHFQREKIAASAKELFDRRALLCIEHDIGLGDLYNRVEDGAFEQLRQLHRNLDRAVVEAYGWSASTVEDPRERNRRLYQLNADVLAGRAPSIRPG